MRLLVSLDGQRSKSLSTLIERLNQDGIRVAGGAMFGDLDATLLFDKPEDTDRAIAWLASIGIHSERG